MSGSSMKKDKGSVRGSTADGAARALRRGARRAAVLLVAVLALLACRPASAAAPPVRVSLLTMGPGNALFTMFGHDALLLEREGLPSLVYNFGMYTPESI